MKKILLSLICLLYLQWGNSQIVITEIMFNPPETGTDSLEYIEIYNAGTTAVDLLGYTLNFGNPAPTVRDSFRVSTLLNPGSFIIFAANDTAVQNQYSLGFTPRQWTGTGLTNTSTLIVLRNGSTVIDSVRYQAAWEPQANGGGNSLQLCDPSTDNSIAANWDTSRVNTGVIINARNLFGSPNALETCLSQPLRVGFASPAVTVNEAVGTISVNVAILNPNANSTTVEMRVGTSSTASASDYTNLTVPQTITFPGSSNATQTISFDIIDDVLTEGNENLILELFNPSNGASFTDSVYNITIVDNDVAPTPLYNLVISEFMYNNPGADSVEFIEIYNNDTVNVDMTGYQITNGVFFTFPTFTLNAGSHVVVCQDTAVFNSRFGISAFRWNTGNSLNNTGEAIVLRNNQAVILDSIFYSNALPWPVAANGNGPSLQLCNINTDNNIGSNWGASTNPTGVFVAGVEIKATPAQQNTICRPNYPYQPIINIEGVNGNGVPDSLGLSYEIRGIVHCNDFRLNAGYEMYVINTGNHGIKVFSGIDRSGYSVSDGDSLHIWGTVAQTNGVTEFVVDSLFLISSGNATVNPIMLGTPLNETQEGSLVMLSNVSLVNATQWTTSTGTGFNVDVTDGTTTWQLRIDDATDLYSQTAPVGNFSVYGFGSQFDTQSPFDSGYQLLACSGSLVTAIDHFDDQNTIQIYPNPTEETVQILSTENIEKLELYNVLGSQLYSQKCNQNSAQLNLSTYSTGLYYIKIYSSKGIITKQVVKK